MHNVTSQYKPLPFNGLVGPLLGSGAAIAADLQLVPRKWHKPLNTHAYIVIAVKTNLLGKLAPSIYILDKLIEVVNS